MLGFVLSAISSILQYSAGEESLKLFYSWMAGSFSGVSYTGLAFMGTMLLVGFLLAFGNAKGLDLILFGDRYASLSGAPLRAFRFRIMLGCSLMTGAVTAFCVMKFGRESVLCIKSKSASLVITAGKISFSISLCSAFRPGSSLEMYPLISSSVP